MRMGTGVKNDRYDSLRIYHHQTTVKEDFQKLKSRNITSSLCDYLLSFLPILHWLPSYSKSYIKGDVISGLTLGLLLVPQSIAYAKLAEIPVEHGLYTAFIASLMYLFFGTSREICVGPLAVPGLLISKLIHDLASEQFTNAEVGSIVALLVGIISVVLGVLRVGLLLDWVPNPIISGFTGGIALSIVLSQFNVMLGIPNVLRSFTAAEKVAAILVNIPSLRWQDCLFGLTSLCFLVCISCLANKFQSNRFLNNFQLASNVALFVLATLTAFLILKGQPNFKLSIVGVVPSGFSFIGLPKYDSGLWAKVVGHLPGIFLAMVLEHMAIAKSFSKQSNYQISNSQELFALGICNVSSSLLSGFPCAGAFSRGAVLHKSGVNSPMVNVLIGCVLLVGFEWLTPAFYYIPNATLAAIVSKAAFSLLPSLEKLRTFYYSHPIDLIQCLVAGVVTFFFGVEWGIGVSMGCVLLFVFYRLSRPKLYLLQEVVDRPNLFVDVNHPAYQTKVNPPGVFLFRIQESLIFPNAGFITEQVLNHIIDNAKPNATSTSGLWSTDTNGKLRKFSWEKPVLTDSGKPNLKAVVLDLSAVNWMDSTALRELNLLKLQLQAYSGFKYLPTPTDKKKVDKIESQLDLQNTVHFQLHLVVIHPQVIKQLIQSGLVDLPDLTDFEPNPILTFTDEFNITTNLSQPNLAEVFNSELEVPKANVKENLGIKDKMKSKLQNYLNKSNSRPNVINLEPLSPKNECNIHLSISDALQVINRTYR